MLSIVISIIAFGLLVLFHELGHFVFAKLFKITVVEFSLGLGPTLCGAVKGETKYSLKAFPFGGACLMLDEELDEAPEEENAAPEKREVITFQGRDFDRKKQFNLAKPWKRFLILLGGPLFNFILALVLGIVITVVSGYDRPVILGVKEGSPAYEAGVRAGDFVSGLSVDGRYSTVKTARDIALFFTANEQLIYNDAPVEISYVTPEGEKHSGTMVSRYDEETGRKIMGLSYSYNYQPADGLSDTVEMGIHEAVYSVRTSVESLRMMFRGEVSADDIGGPVMIVATMDEAVSSANENYGTASAVLTLLSMCILLSGSLGFMNLLPFPALDGGKILLVLAEIVTGKRLPKKVENGINMAGMLILLLLMFVILFKDIFTLIG